MSNVRQIIGDATLYQGDCLEILPTIEFDVAALVSDPPYGIDLHGMSGSYASRCFNREDRVDKPGAYLIHGDDKPFDPTACLRFPKIILWGGIHFAQRLPDSRCWLVWDKREGTTSDNQADCEIAWTSLPGPARLHSQLWRGIMRRGEENVSKQARCHPAQKPIDLMGWCIALCKLQPGQVVLDPYMGSGTTGIAAVRGGYRFIGIEIDAKHFDTACKRIEQEQKQGQMFA